jgi:hypothetical protein
MELLLTTSLSPAEFVSGRIRALRQRFLFPLLLLAVLDGAFALHFLPLLATSSGDESIGYLWCCRILILAADALAIAWTGTWLGIAMKSNRTTLAVWSPIVLLPCAVMGAFLAGGTFHRPGALVFYWLIINLSNAGWWLSISHSRLRTEFRDRAVQPTK